MAEINHPHDTFFKRLFGHLATAADFMRNYLPDEVVAQLDLETLVLEKESFTDPKLRSHFSDLLFRVRLLSGGDLFIFLLLEHKSAPDPWVAFQLLRYIVRLWERLYDQGCKKLPMIIPIVFYHGEDRWNVSRRFDALLEAPGIAALQKYALGFEYDLQDVSLRGGAAIKGGARLRTGLELMRNIFSDGLGKRLPEIFRNLREMTLTDALEYLQTLLAYLSHASRKVKKEEIMEAIQTAIPREEFSREALFVQEWIAEGEQQGIPLGEHRGLFSLTLRLARDRFGHIDEATQERVRSLPNNLLAELGAAVVSFASLNELHQWLSKAEKN